MLLTDGSHLAWDTCEVVPSPPGVKNADTPGKADIISFGEGGRWLLRLRVEKKLRALPSPGLPAGWMLIRLHPWFLFRLSCCLLRAPKHEATV